MREHPFDLKAYLDEKRVLVDRALETYFPQPKGPASDLIKAMRYSLFAGGKRLRPILCMAGAEAVSPGATAGLEVLPVACALELIHTYSLIHDDLPAMDNDDLRRGKPTNHKVFGEALAILAGDGLLTEAFYLMSRTDIMKGLDQDALTRTIGLIAKASGHEGMVGGQALDIQTEGKSVELSTLEFIHTRKTGALIEASVTAGALLAGGKEAQMERISVYGLSIGHAFQISDDILDVEGDTVLLGKRAGADERRGKNTYPALLGLQGSKEMQEKLVKLAIEALDPFDHRAEPLRQIARYIIQRRK